MPAQKGRDLLLKMSDGTSPGTFTTVAGLRDTTLTITDNEVDITTKDSSGIRQLLSGTFLLSMSVSGSGVFQDDTIANRLRTAITAGTHYKFQILVPTQTTGAGDAGGIYEGFFRVTNLEYSGTFDGEVQYSISLASAGTIAFTLAA